MELFFRFIFVWVKKSEEWKQSWLLFFFLEREMREMEIGDKRKQYDVQSTAGVNMEKQRMKWGLREKREVWVYWYTLGESQGQLQKHVWVLWQRSMRILLLFLHIQPTWWGNTTCICIVGQAWSQGFQRSCIQIHCWCWSETVEVKCDWGWYLELMVQGWRHGRLGGQIIGSWGIRGWISECWLEQWCWGPPQSHGLMQRWGLAQGRQRGLGFSLCWQRRVKHWWWNLGHCCMWIMWAKVSWTSYCVGNCSKSGGIVWEFD